MPEIILKRRCNRCGYEWWPKTPKEPLTCPNKSCRSPYWNRERIQKNPLKGG
jgi:hypothetical protein